MWKKQEDLEANDAIVEKLKEIGSLIGKKLEKMAEEKTLEALLRNNLETFENEIRRMGIPDDIEISPDQIQAIWYQTHQLATEFYDMTSLPHPPLTQKEENNEKINRVHKKLAQHVKDFDASQKLDFFWELSKKEDKDFQREILIQAGVPDDVEITPAKLKEIRDQIDKDINTSLLGMQFSEIKNPDISSAFIKALLESKNEQRSKIFEQQTSDSMKLLRESLSSSSKLSVVFTNDRSGELYDEVAEFIERSSAGSSPLPNYIDVIEIKKSEMKESNKELHATIAKLPISSKNKMLILDCMVALKANLAVLDAKIKAGTITPAEEAVYESGAELYIQFDDRIRNKAFSDILKNPKACNDFVKMLKSAGELSLLDSKNPNQGKIIDVFNETTDQTSFTPMQDALWSGLQKALAVFAMVVTITLCLAAAAAIVYFTGGLGLPFLAPLVPMIASAATSLLAFGTTAAAATATVATTAAATATTAAATVTATATTTAAAAATLAAAHPIIAGAALGTSAGGAVLGTTVAVTQKMERGEATKRTIQEMKSNLKDTLGSYIEAAEKAKKPADHTARGEENRDDATPATPSRR